MDDLEKLKGTGTWTPLGAAPKRAPRAAPRELRLRLDDPALEQVLAFARAAYPELPITAAVRELLLLGAGADPLNAAISATRIAVYQHYSKIARETIAAALRQLAATLEVEEEILQAARGPLPEQY